MSDASNSAPSLLVVDDDDVFRDRVARAFQDRGYDVRAAPSAEAAVALAKADSPELAVVDLRMPGESGLWLVEELLRVDAATRIVILTGFGSVATAVEAIKRGAHHYLQKPTTVDEIEAALSGAPPVPPSAPLADLPSLARNEWEYIQRVLHESDGNVSEAARRLGLHRRSLQRKLQKHPPKR
jgi:two-component system response regulator RegA